jgi:hypothetical protein
MSTHAKHITRLCNSFRSVEERYCIRTHADLFRDWINQFRVPVEELPPRPNETSGQGGYCAEGLDIFFVFWIAEEWLFGAPNVPNASDSGLPRDKTIGYRIPLDALKAVPKVKRKHGYTDADGYVIS